MNKTSRGFAPIVILILVFVTLAGVGAFYFGVKNKVSNWKTYIDPQGVYSFEYPQSWYFEPVPPEKNSVAFFQKGESARFFAYDLPGNEVMIVGPLQKAYTVAEAKAKPILQEASFTSVNNNPIVKTPTFIAIWSGGSSDKIVPISQFDRAQPYLDQILSTFKFLD